jgi:hypothetical protein
MQVFVEAKCADLLTQDKSSSRYMYYLIGRHQKHTVDLLSGVVYSHWLANKYM